MLGSVLRRYYFFVCKFGLLTDFKLHLYHASSKYRVLMMNDVDEVMCVNLKKKIYFKHCLILFSFLFSVYLALLFSFLFFFNFNLQRELHLVRVKLKKGDIFYIMVKKREIKKVKLFVKKINEYKGFCDLYSL